MKEIISCFALLSFALFSCSSPQEAAPVSSAQADHSFLQDYSIKYYFPDKAVPKKVFEDRNGTIQVLSEDGLYRTHAGLFLYPGELVPDRTYLPMADKNLSGLAMLQEQFLYLDDEAVFGNAWAGSLYIKHQLGRPSLVASGHSFNFLISDGTTM